MKSHNTDHDHYLDIIGLHCPHPVINCKATLVKMIEGEILKLVCSDKASLNEIPKLVEYLGDELIEIGQQLNQYHYTIRRNSRRKGRAVESSGLLDFTGMAGLLQLIGVGAPVESY